MRTNFKSGHLPKDIVLYAVFFYVHFAVSYRDIERHMAERGVQVDLATLNYWVVKFSPFLVKNAQRKATLAAASWRINETNIKLRGRWIYLYRAVNRDDQTLDFMLLERRGSAAARRFFKRAIGVNGVPVNWLSCYIDDVKKTALAFKNLCENTDSITNLLKNWTGGKKISARVKQRNCMAISPGCDSRFPVNATFIHLSLIHI